MSNTGSMPPGWYPAAGDPPGTQRWWDGTGWVGDPVVAGGAPAPYPYGARPVEYAGWWRRFGAVFLDGLIVGVPTQILHAIFRVTIAPTELRRCPSGVGLCERVTPGAELVWSLVSIAIALLVGWFYYAAMISRTGQTLGKRACGVRVVRAGTGELCSQPRAFGRNFASILSALPCFLGFLWPLWDPHKQSFHDKICDTVVIRA